MADASSCVNHPGVPPVTLCAACRRGICGSCKTYFQGNLYCPEDAKRLGADSAPGPAPNIIYAESPIEGFQRTSNFTQEVGGMIRWASRIVLLSGILGALAGLVVLLLAVAVLGLSGSNGQAATAGAIILVLGLVLLVFSSTEIVLSRQLRAGSRRAGKVIAALCAVSIGLGALLTMGGDVSGFFGIPLNVIVLVLLAAGWNDLT
ncbi:MAG: hypothetical protein KGI89_16995 [Euryarchaeota archaeon]|nr:hypothetical protein [Euryarchaeota archaeon]